MSENKNPFLSHAITWTAIWAGCTLLFLLVYLVPSILAEIEASSIAPLMVGVLVMCFVCCGGIPAVALWGRVGHWNKNQSSPETNTDMLNYNGYYSINTKTNQISIRGIVYDLNKVDKSSIEYLDQHDHHRGKAVSLNITVSFMVGTDYVSIIFLDRAKYLTSDDYRDAAARAKQLIAILNKYGE